MIIDNWICKILIPFSVIILCISACGPNIEKLYENEDIDALLEILADDKRYDSEERADAANALGLIADKKVVKPLIDGLMDSHRNVREAALFALQQINDPEYKDEVEIIEKLDSDNNIEFLWDFVLSLQKNHYNAIGGLAYISSKSEYNTEIQEWAISTLLEIDLNSLIIAASSDDELISRDALSAIEVLGSNMIPFLKDALSSNNTQIKTFAEDYLATNEYFSGEICRNIRQGVAIPEVSEYNPSELGPHPMYICDYFIKYGLGWNNELPLEWRIWDFSFEELELIVLIENNDHIVEKCDYYNRNNNQFSFSIYRYQRRLDVELIEAQTGKKINSFTMFGSMPGACPDLSYNKDIFGNFPEYNQLQDWLRTQGLDL